jgi:hypothetical protein
MTHHPGAIVLIVFYSLKEHGCKQDWFTADDLFAWISDLRKEPHAGRHFAGLVGYFMKHHRKKFPLTLETQGRLSSWLRLHVGRKRIFWFEKNNGQFRVKREHQKRLSKYMLQLKKAPAKP